MGQYMPYPQQIPVKVQQLAEAHQLGAPTAAYNKAASRVFVGIVLIVICFVIIPLTSLLGSLSNPAAYSNGPPVAFDLFALACAFAAIGLLLAVYRLRRMYLYTEGLVYRTWLKAEVLRWEQIASVVRTTTPTKSLGLAVRKTDGTRLNFPMTFPYPECVQVCDTVERGFARTHGIGVGLRDD